LTIAAGCECAATASAAAPMVLPVPSAPGTCTRRTVTRTSYNCDFIGNLWCEQRASTRWTLHDGTACSSKNTIVDYPVGSYSPDAGWGKDAAAVGVRATPSPSPTAAAAAPTRTKAEATSSEEKEAAPAPKASEEEASASKQDPSTFKEEAPASKEEPAASEETASTSTAKSTRA